MVIRVCKMNTIKGETILTSSLAREPTIKTRILTSTLPKKKIKLSPCSWSKESGHHYLMGHMRYIKDQKIQPYGEFRTQYME